MKAGKVYVLRRSDGLIKIGYTSDFKNRLRVLSKAHGPLEVIRIIHGDKARERSLHNRFARQHQFGEWFRDEGGLLEHVRALEDGTKVSVTKDAARKAWIEGEAAMAAEAHELCRSLVHARVQRTHCTRGQAMNVVADDYGFSIWTLENLSKGKAASVTAYTMKRLREALAEELLAQRQALLDDIAAIEAGGSLASRLEAAKGAAKAGRK